MDTLLHLGVGHPNLLWIAAAGLIAFVAGLVVNLYRSSDESQAAVPDEPAE